MDLPLKCLSIMVGLVRQEEADGELSLEQSDGLRRFHFAKGELVHLISEVPAERFGAYLLRQGTLDLQELNQLLANEEPYRIGEKVVQFGMLSQGDRNQHLQSLQERIMIHALEHPVVQWTWSASSPDFKLGAGLPFRLEPRRFVWTTFQEAHPLPGVQKALEEAVGWRWTARNNLLERMSDLPLTPQTAYALSLLGPDPISFEAICSLSGLSGEDASRVVTSLWAIGALELAAGQVPRISGPGTEPVQPKYFGPPPEFTTARLEGGAENAPAPNPKPPEGMAAPIDPTSAQVPVEFLDPEEAEGTPRYPQLDGGYPGYFGSEDQDLPPWPTAQPQPGPGSHPRQDPFLRPAPPAPEPYRAPVNPPFPPEEPVIELGRNPAAPHPGRQDPFWRPAGEGLPKPPAPPAPQPNPPLRPQPAAAQAPTPAAQPAPEPPDPFQMPMPPMPPPQPLQGAARARSLVAQARQQSQMNRTVEAIRSLEQALQLGQLEPDLGYLAWLLLGQLRMSNPAWSTRAIDALQHAAALRPKLADPWAAMGEIYHRKGFEANAAACFRRCQEIEPGYPIPVDIDMEASEAPSAEDRKGKQSLFKRMRNLLG